MRRRFAAVLAATLLATGLAVLAPAGPARATSVCGGQGTAAVTPGLLYPIGLPLVTINLRTPTLGQRVVVTFNNELVFASWNFTFGTGSCTNGKTLSASGSLKGYCGHSTGTGSTGTHLVEWTSVGSFLILTNGLVGIANAIPDAVGGESCAHGGSLSIHTDATLTTTAIGPPLPAGATRFLVQGAVVKTNCATSVPPGLTSTLLLDLNLQQTVLNDLIHITTPAAPNIHVRLHICVPSKL